MNIVTGSSSSYENEDLRPSTKTKSHYENEEPLRKRRPPAKKEDSLRNPPTYENEDILLKQVQKRLVLPLWTKIMFMRHTTKTKILTEILNSEFGTSAILSEIFQQ